MKIRVLKTVSAVVAAVVFGGMFSSCTKEYKMTKWRGAFIKNDSIIGTFKWTIDYTEATNEFGTTQHDNVRQYYCEYNVNTGKLKQVKKLRDDEGKIPYNHNVVYNYPYVYFCTRTYKEYIGIYNLETGADELFKEGNKPICVSEDNRYLGFKGGIQMDRQIYDFQNDSIIWGKNSLMPIYIESQDRRALLKSLHYFMYLDFETGKIDTIAEETFGRIYHNASNDITVFKSDSGGFYYLNNSALIEGIFEHHKLENLNRYGAGHVDIDSKQAVYSTGDGIYYMNHGENKEAELILNYKREDL